MGKVKCQQSDLACLILDIIQHMVFYLLVSLQGSVWIFQQFCQCLLKFSALQTYTYTLTHRENPHFSEWVKTQNPHLLVQYCIHSLGWRHIRNCIIKRDSISQKWGGTKKFTCLYIYANTIQLYSTQNGMEHKTKTQSKGQYDKNTKMISNNKQ